MDTLSRVICDLHRDLKDIKASLPGHELGSDRGEKKGSLSSTWDLLNEKIYLAEKALKARAVEAIEAVDKKKTESSRESPGIPLNFNEARQKFNIPGPSRRQLRQPKPTQKSSGRVRRNRMAGPRRILPTVNRRNPFAEQPSIGERDLDDGLLKLLNKGFVPSNADLTPAFERGIPCIKSDQVPLYDPSMKNLLQIPQPTGIPVKLDLEIPTYCPPQTAPLRRQYHTHFSAYLPPIPSTAPSPYNTQMVSDERIFGDNVLVPYRPQGQGGSPSNREPFYEGSPTNQSSWPPSPSWNRGGTFYTEVVDDDGKTIPGSAEQQHQERSQSPPSSQHYFPGDLVIRYGSLFTDIVALRESFHRNWAQVQWMLARLGYLLREAPVAYVNTPKLVKLLARDGRVRRIKGYLVPDVTDMDLMQCMNNVEDIIRSCKHLVAGVRFLSKNRHKVAVTYISASWRMICMKRYFRVLKLRNLKARVIQMYWKLFKIKWKIKETIRSRQEDRQAHFRRLQISFAQGWDDIRGSRVEIHVCSLSIDELRRGSMDNYQARQIQLGRIFRAATSNNQIIYVAPQEMHEDLQDYFFKVLAFRGLHKPEAKIQFVVPENIPGKKFPPHLSLTYALMYSPRTLKRIRQLLKGQEHTAMLVFGSLITVAEMDLSVALGVPIYGCDPKKIDLLYTKSAHKRVLTMANIPIPIQATDIYDTTEMIAQLANLVYNNPNLSTWLIKIDDEIGSAGTGVLDVRPLNLRKEDEKTIQQILAKNLARRLRLPQGYKTYGAFTAQISTVGGIIQAMPEEVESYPSIHCKIDPNANVSVLGTSESLLTLSTEIISSFIPQTSVPQPSLDDIAYRVCRVLASKGVCGFVSIDCVVFKNPDYKENEPREDAPLMIGGETLGGETPKADSTGVMFTNLKSPSPELPDNAPIHRPDFEQLPPSRQQKILDCFQNAENEVDGADDFRGMVTSGVRNRNPKSLWVVDIDLGITEAMSMLWPFQFIGQVERSNQTGDYTLAPHAPTYVEGKPETRVALTVPMSLCPAMSTMNCQGVFQLLKSKAQSYDLWSNMGSILVHLDVYSELFSALSIAPTRELVSLKVVLLLRTLLTHGEPTRPETKELMVREVLAALLTMHRRLTREESSLKSNPSLAKNLRD